LGQQQLLLLVLGLIVVGISIVIAISLYDTYMINSSRDNLIAESVNLASLAQRYYQRLNALGGGEGRFTGWAIPLNLKATDSGTYTEIVYIDSVIITGTGFISINEDEMIQVKVSVTPNEIITEVIN
jgi:Tfp pilus assembly protein PilE